MKVSEVTWEQYSLFTNDEINQFISELEKEDFEVQLKVMFNLISQCPYEEAEKLRIIRNNFSEVFTEIKRNFEKEELSILECIKKFLKALFR
jgi:hypothetical protein